MAVKGELLFLAHRIPYPPNKGDKIRSFHLLEYLSRRFTVHLGAFVDDPKDWAHASALRARCGEVEFRPLPRWKAKLRSLRGFLTGQALTVPYYFDPAMARWVRRMVRNRPLTAAVVFSSAMAQYLEDLPLGRRIIDFVDVDSDKWRQYASGRPWPSSWVYGREARTLLAYDRRMAGLFDSALFVSEHEGQLFSELAPEVCGRVRVMKNGVDGAYFDDRGTYPNPYPAGVDALVFTGAMDYWPNVDAVVWFARNILPEVLRAHSQLRFYIVGSNPSAEVLELAQTGGTVVTGAVPDVRPYLAHARLVLAPLRVARGVQNKVLEALAMGKPVLASPSAVRGIQPERGLDLTVASCDREWGIAIGRMLDGELLPTYSPVNRQFVLNHYDWERNLACLESLLEGV